MSISAYLGTILMGTSSATVSEETVGVGNSSGSVGAETRNRDGLASLEIP